jgi:ASC-1-like (ASCH) protein
MKIEKKTWPESFNKILEGRKSFDIRLADFEVKAGDEIVFREWDPERKEYTGRMLEKKVVHISKTKELPYWNKEDVDNIGLVIIGLGE